MQKKPIPSPKDVNHCGVRVFLTEQYTLRHLTVAERLVRIGETVFKVDHQQVFFGICPNCCELLVAYLPVGRLGEVFGDFRFVKKTNRRRWWWGRVRAEHPWLSSERMSWVLGTAMDGTYRQVRKPVT